jgi:hypothetical protein
MHAHTFTLDAYANELMSTVHPTNFDAYNHTDVIVKSLELSSMHVNIQKYMERS